jgi:ABC-type Fe3+ transport system substrate-binding protein
MRIGVGSAALLVALALGWPASAAEWNAGGGAAWDELVAGAKQEGGPVLAACPEMANWISEAFPADTGVNVSFISGDLADTSNRFALELETGNITIDVSLGGVREVALVKDGKLQSLPELLVLPDVTDAQNWLDGHIQFADNAGRYLAIASEYLSSRPVINTEVVDPAALQTLDDLMKPEWKDKIAGFDPSVAGAGQSMASYFAHLRGIDFVRSLYKQQNIALSRDSRQLLEWAARGTYPIILGVEVSVLERLREAGMDMLTMVPLQDAPGATVGGCSVISIPKGAPHPKSAQLFLNWYLSHAGQQGFEAALHLPSRRTDLPHEGIADYLLLKPGEDYLSTYREDWYLTERVPLRAAITDLFAQ